MLMALMDSGGNIKDIGGNGRDTGGGEVDHFRDIGRMIADPFEITRHEQQLGGVADRRRIFDHVADQIAENRIVEGVPAVTTTAAVPTTQAKTDSPATQGNTPSIDNKNSQSVAPNE